MAVHNHDYDPTCLEVDVAGVKKGQCMFEGGLCCDQESTCTRACAWAERAQTQDEPSRPLDSKGPSFEAALDYQLDEVRKVMLDRHRKYGPGNILRHGELGVIVRLGDKYERLDNGMNDFDDESATDAFLDIVGYGLIGLMLRNKAWPGQST